jgi:hypothetical protein
MWVSGEIRHVPTQSPSSRSNSKRVFHITCVCAVIQDVLLHNLKQYQPLALGMGLHDAYQLDLWVPLGDYSIS